MSRSYGGTGDDRLATLVAALDDAAFEVRDGVISSWNDAAERLLGHRAADVVGRDARLLLPEGVTSFDGAGTLVDAGGSPVQVSITEAAGYVVARDRRAESFRALVERAAHLLVVCDPDGCVTYATPGERTPSGRRRADLVGTNVFDVVHETDLVNARAALAACCVGRGPHPPFVVRSRDIAGRSRWHRLSVTNLLDDPAVRGLAVSVQDVTAQRRAEDELARYAPVDAVTGVLTRYALGREVAAARAAAGEGGPASALVLVEADGVRDLVADEGSPAGDAVLRLAAERLRETAPDDVVGRVGGATFAVFRPRATDEREALALAEDALAAVREPVGVGGDTRRLAASAGVTVSRSADLNVLVSEADTARRRAALHTGASVEAFTPGAADDVVRWAGVVSSLRNGIRTGELRLHYQRCVRIGDGVTVGAEALLRWRGPGGELLGPDDFLAAATAAGSARDVCAWVLRTACRDAAGWPRDQYVAVNLSPVELAAPSLPAAVRDALGESGLDPARLAVEVAEVAVRDGDATARDAITALSGLGVRLAIDDFGTGFGSLVHLKRLPVTTIKIGREFVSGLGRSDDDVAIVAAVLNLATGVGAGVVAVGVETPEQHLTLAHLGCPAAQGFLYGAPEPAAPDPEPFALPRSSAGYARPPRRASGVDPVVVARVRTLVAEGASLSTIAAALNAEALPHPKDRRWHPRSVAHLVADVTDAARGRKS